ncbi:MAG: hypothetical protein OXF25_04910 [Cyanobacteria bacterium MAG CAR3_bin_5]|nr:hypothetical protein [Cyanobacteria bacterium MAG CAR3_bin_5]
MAAWLKVTISAWSPPSLSARTVTVWTVSQLPVLPGVNIKVFWLPSVVVSVSTETAESSLLVMVTVLPLPGSVLNATV